MQKQGERVKLSISIMVSNSVDTIRKCMESLVPILENVSSELIIVDTGGTDGSIDIAREYADQVVKFEWCKDFAKARNAGLERATGEWFMFLDDDEWFEDAIDLINFFNTEEYKKYRCASYVIRNYTNIQGTAWHDVRSYRMVRMEESTKFICPIHETLDPIYFPEKVLECYLHHYGYVYKDEVEMRKHGLRNISLIKEVLEKEPKNYRLWLQLAQEYRSINEIQLSEEVSLDVIGKIKSFEKLDRAEKKMLGWILHNIIGMKIIKQDYQSAYEYGNKFLKYNWLNNISQNVISYRVASLCYELEKYKEVFTHIETYEKTYFKLNNSLQLRREEIVLDLEELITEKQLVELYVIGICSAYKTNKRDKIAIYIKKIVSLESFPRNERELEELIKCLLEEKWNTRNRLLTYLFKNEDNKKIIASLTESDKWSEEESKEIFKMLASIDVEAADTLPYRLVNLFEENQNIQKELEDYLEDKENILEVINALWEIINVLRMDISKYIDKKEIAKWVEEVNTFVIYGKEEKNDLVLKVLEYTNKKNFKTEILRMRCIEKKMKADSIKEKEFGEIIHLGNQYCGLVFDTYSNLYNPESFRNEFSSLLPKECRFALKLEELLNADKRENEKIDLIRVIISIYPEMAEYCKRIAVQMKENIKSKSKETDEFYMLAQNIKDKIYLFLEQGNKEVAKQILLQLKQLVPNDTEIEEIERQIIA